MLTDTPAPSILWLKRAMPEIISTRDAENPPCKKPKAFACSG